MLRSTILLVAVVLLSMSGFCDCVDTKEESEARQLLEDVNKELLQMRNNEAEVSWAFATNINPDNEKRKIEVASQNAKRFKEIVQNLKKFNYDTFNDKELQRQFKLLTDLGQAALSDKEYYQLEEAVSKMEGIYSTEKLCPFRNNGSECKISLEPHITEIFMNSRNPEELSYYWTEWYNRMGELNRDHFKLYVELVNKAAQLNGYPSTAEYWLSKYEEKTFEKQIEDILKQISPFYKELHGYVRWRLRQKYGEKIVPEKGLIPMHLLGNLWGQSWGPIFDILNPFPENTKIDVTEEMLKQGYTPLKMFQMGDEFFQSMNMTKLPQTFWEKSVIEKPQDGREIICHASAWDFFKPDDVRIKQCTRVNMDDFFTVHHELGHIQYYLQYQHLPISFRTGANPGFHEAVGDVISLSVSTPKHLEKIQLLKEYTLDTETIINTLLQTALDKVVFLPFAYTLDKYRWEVFRGNIKPDEYNSAFWKLRAKHSGIQPPVERTEKNFDALAKYHVIADVEYARYFVSHIVQFQFYKASCEKSKQYKPDNLADPLYNCDIHGSSEAGNAFKAMLSLGASKLWPDAMEQFTGERVMSANALLEYFKPLHSWLQDFNKKHNVYLGWDYPGEQ